MPQMGQMRLPWRAHGQGRAEGESGRRREGERAVRFRKVPNLRITFFSLGIYYHALPKDYDIAHPITVYFDNLVIARQYIGPMGGKGAASAPAMR